MEKRKRWQWVIIGAVLALTVYNILPTVFFYSKPLDQPVGQKTAQHVSHQIATRVNDLEGESISWIKSYAKNLKVKPTAVAINPTDPKLIDVTFGKAADAKIFKHFFNQAGAYISFAPAQLQLATDLPNQSATKVTLERQLATAFNPKQLPKYFSFSTQQDEDGAPTELYRKISNDRFVKLALATGGTSEAGRQLEVALNPQTSYEEGFLLNLAQQIVEHERAFGLDHPLTQRYFASVSQVSGSEDHRALIQNFAAHMEQTKQKLNGEIASVKTAAQAAEDTSGEALLAQADQQKIQVLERQVASLDQALTLVKGNVDLFASGQTPLTEQEIFSFLQNSEDAREQQLRLEGRNPYIESLTLNWDTEQIALNVYPELQQLLEEEASTERQAYEAEKLNQWIINQIASIGRVSDETISPRLNEYIIALNALTGSSSFLTLDLAAVAAQRVDQIAHRLEEAWQPTHQDFTRERFPVYTYDQFQNLEREEQQLGLTVYAPVMEQETPPAGFRMGSVYVIGKGIAQIADKAMSVAQGEKSDLQDDFEALSDLLAQNGFIGYPAASYGFGPEYKNDFIFELDDYYSPLLMATREDFTVKGTKRYAVLEFTDIKQRLLTVNAIETEAHEDLLKWRDEYQAAQVSLDPNLKYEIPPLTRSPLWQNLNLSAHKYFRGDERKVLKWGLDLSGGKSVTIGLRDHNNRAVTDPADLKEGANELYSRVNKMGVSEVEIRTEGNHIVLNFPGAQALSASELIKASTMTFHMVNEKFGPSNAELAPAVNRFLQEVWNEAVITNRKDLTNLNEIAWKRLGGDEDADGIATPLSEAARILADHGLQLANPHITPQTTTFDDTLSSVGMWRGESLTDWNNQANPLVILFHNYALEGSNLENVHAEYDPGKGNVLIFGIKRSGKTPDGLSYNPQADLFAWTAPFAQNKIAGTPREAFSRGNGWRLAVMLNDQVISAPALNEGLKSSAMVTGQFSQREINSLVADLKAGSLSFTPKILSEKNVSPDLGHRERMQGIVAALIGLALLVILMTSIYRFAGIVASIAVAINLLIIWGVLQNLDAALTLPGIAGIILTMGMAVDANVLVFERIREEFALSGRIHSAIQAGYRKAFTAIFDSNLTTIIAALILLQFDAGPIKGFAVTLIVGIISSMFTALFMTRTFFSYWVQNPKHKALKMARLFHKTKFDFLGKAKLAVVGSLILIVVGGGVLVSQRHQIFGMDFTGGYSVSVALEPQADVNYRAAVTQALVDAGAAARDVQVRELNKPNFLRIQLGMGLELLGQPFAQLPFAQESEEGLYGYQANPRLNWLVEALEAQGLALQPSSLANLQDQWNVMSGQFSDTMRDQAMLGLGLALLCILVYITIRFEFKYAIGATVALAHDLLISVGVLAILNLLGVPIQIDLQVVGALMTIIGYSLNDTIIIFDRIREDSRVLRKLTFNELVNHALNTTLNRTLMTSTTTLIVILALVIFGGGSIFGFSLVMTMGIVFGTYSSLFIAAPVLRFFHNREVQQHEGGAPAKA